MRRRHLATLCWSAAALFALSDAAMAVDSSSAIAAALRNPARPPFDIERDAQMKPAEVLAFAGVKPGMAVADLVPGYGYYSRILSGVVGPKAHVYMVVPQAAGDLPARLGPVTKDPNQNIPLSRVENAYNVQDSPDLKNVVVYWEGFHLNNGLFGFPEQLDMIFSDRGYHVLKTKEFAKTDMAATDKLMFLAMKPGGTVVFIDNAANKGAGFGVADSLGRIDADALKAEITAAGFVFDGESALFANPSDDRSKPAGDNADRFILRFKKPADAPKDKRPPVSVIAGYFENTHRSNILATGNVTGQRERRVIYHADRTYEEFGAKNTGTNPWQNGTWFFDAQGRICMLHQMPVDQRGQVNCNPLTYNKKAGDKWTTPDGKSDELVKGYAYFEDAKAR
jgi:predicted methyltransferase